MREIFIKYNPYKVETEITIDKKPPKPNSELNVSDRRFQEWVEELPKILVEECNTKNFKIIFHGTQLDYEDLQAVAQEAQTKGIKIACEHIKAKEVADKEKSIRKVFQDIQNGPLNELKQPDVIQSFEAANNSEFPVNVIATMSAGKSTLINALLQQKLMPAKQEACTATITEIKDNDALNSFSATAYTSAGDMLEMHNKLTLSIMEQLNANPQVSTIRAEGDIPFVSSDEIALVLVDTPGPNNSRDPEHQATTYRMISQSSKTLVMYVLNATQLAVNDDSSLLSYVADSMRVGGKQSKDRFIFVINKLDDFKIGEDSVASAITKVKQYLEDKGIKNPNIYPTTALTALDIRTTLKQFDMATSLNDIDDPEIFGVIAKMKKINQNPEFHLEKYSPLISSLKNNIDQRLKHALAQNDLKEQALIHSGIIPIEYAIKLYVDKYAKTAQIKNIVDTFSKKLESAQSLEKLKQEISIHEDHRENLIKQIDQLNKNLADGQAFNQFKAEVNEIDYMENVEKLSNDVIQSAQREIEHFWDTAFGENDSVSLETAKKICDSFKRFAEDTQSRVQVELENAISTYTTSIADTLIAMYTSNLKSLNETFSISEVTVHPLDLIKGELDSSFTSETYLESISQIVEVKVGERRNKNSSRKWWNPFTWTEPKYYFTDIVEEQQKVSRASLSLTSGKFLDNMFENHDSVCMYAVTVQEKIKNHFNETFAALNLLLEKKLDDLKTYALDKDNVEKQLQESAERLQWLKNIQQQIQQIMDI